MKPIEVAIAHNRLGLGARPGDLRDPSASDRSALTDQVSRAASFLLDDKNLPSSTKAGGVLANYVNLRRGQKTASAGVMSMTPEQQMQAAAGPVKELIRFSVPDVVARTRHAASTPNGFAERLVLFWSNHFTVGATKAITIPYAGVFEREAIRANLTGSFADLLIASTRHPGMMIYLDQVQSIGPNSVIGQRRSAGLNENLAREILELHTVGVHAGYSQADVTEFARALTGSLIANDRIAQFAPDAKLGQFAFVEAAHEPGQRTILGKKYAEAGSGQSLAILRDLAKHPATAKHIATKLARHFCADVPPTELVSHLETTFLKTEGDLPSLHRAIVENPAIWSADMRKFKSPNEFLISTYRAAGVPELDPRALAASYTALGQLPFRAPSPAGWPDDASNWSGADSVMKRLEWTQSFVSQHVIDKRPVDIAEAALGASLSSRTREAVKLAQTPVEGVVLALMSPEFQRR